MPRSRILAAAAATSAIALATLLVASPAHAATLPEGQRITVIDSFDGEVFEASPSTAGLTLIGPGILIEGEYVSAVEVDDAGLGYALVTSTEGGWGSTVVIPVDANTGTAGTPVNVSIPSVGSLGYGCHALDLRDGVYYTSCFTGDGEGVWLTHFGALDPVTGVLDVILTFEEEILFTAFASNPVTGQFWAFEYNSGLSLTWAVNPADWTFTTDLELEQPVWSADFDRGGQLFVSTWLESGQEVYAQLSVLDPVGGVFSPVGVYSYEGLPLEQNQQPPLTVWGAAPSPALPATGGGFEYVPVGIGAALLLLAGVALMLTRRIDRRA